MKNWKDLLNIESKDSHWEIINHDETIILHYVPEDDYSEKDIRIEMPIEHFEELCVFIKNL